MTALTLVIGNKNYSSWSLRPWLVLRRAGIPFREVRIPLDTPGFADVVRRWSPAGRVPVLHDGGLTIWDSLAIVEHLAERHPEAEIWPSAPEARALARSIAAEMHAGFEALRAACPMNCRGRFPGRALPEAARRDVERVRALWRDARERFGAGGEFLCGPWSAADAFYAPVVSRFVTYGIPLDGAEGAWARTLLDTEPMREWLAAAAAEPERIEAAEF